MTKRTMARTSCAAALVRLARQVERLNAQRRAGLKTRRLRDQEFRATSKERRGFAAWVNADRLDQPLPPLRECGERQDETRAATWRGMGHRR